MFLVLFPFVVPVNVNHPTPCTRQLHAQRPTIVTQQHGLTNPQLQAHCGEQ